MLFDIGTPSAATGAAELSDDAVVCNCNGVSKGDIVACVASGCTSGAGMREDPRRRDAGREGHGRRHRHPRSGFGPDRRRLRRLVRAVHPDDQTRTDRSDPARDLRSVSEVIAELAPDGRDARQDAAGVAVPGDLGADWKREEGALFINDRVHANIQRDGTFSVVPQMRAGHLAGAVAQDRRRRREVRHSDDQGDRRAASTCWGAQEDLPKGMGGSGHAIGLRLRKELPHRKTCVETDYCRFGLRRLTRSASLWKTVIGAGITGETERP